MLFTINVGIKEHLLLLELSPVTAQVGYVMFLIPLRPGGLELIMDVPSLMGCLFHWEPCPPKVLRFINETKVPKEGLLGNRVKREDSGAMQLGSNPGSATY